MATKKTAAAAKKTAPAARIRKPAEIAGSAARRGDAAAESLRIVHTFTAGDRVEYTVFDKNPMLAGRQIGTIRSAEHHGEHLLIVIESAEDLAQSRPASVKAWIIPQFVTGPDAPKADEYGMAPEPTTTAATPAPENPNATEADAAEEKLRKKSKVVALGYHGPAHTQAAAMIAEATKNLAGNRAGHTTVSVPAGVMTAYYLLTPSDPQAIVDGLLALPGGKELWMAHPIKASKEGEAAAIASAGGKLPVVAMLPAAV